MPAMLLMILIALYGYFGPYSWTVPNLVEIAVLVNFLIMLLIRSDPSIVERYSVLPATNVTSSLAEFTNCNIDQEVDYSIITPLTIILTVFCYAPLVLYALILVFAAFWFLSTIKYGRWIGSKINVWQRNERFRKKYRDMSPAITQSTVVSETLVSMDGIEED